MQNQSISLNFPKKAEDAANSQSFSTWSPLSKQKAQKLLNALFSTHASSRHKTLSLYSPRHNEGIYLLYIIIPFRDRHSQLETALTTLTTYLDAIFKGLANFQYHFIIAEQCDEQPFNRGVLFNVSALYIKSLVDAWIQNGGDEEVIPYCCFHDVDIIPRGRHFDFDYCGNAPCYYYCPPKGHLMHLYGHMWSVGGVFSIRLDDFITTKGFSNLFWGWGWEDCDFQHRCEKSGIVVDRSKFSERLTGASSFIELDKTPVDLHTTLADHLESKEAKQNMEIYVQKLTEKGINEGIYEAENAFHNGRIKVLRRSSDNLNPSHEETNEFHFNAKECYGQRLHWLKIFVNESFK